MAEPSPTRRRFRQFSLRGLLVVLALVAIAFGIWSNASAQREWRALRSFDKGLRVSLTRRNSLGSLEYVQGFQTQAKLVRVGDPPSPWALWRTDTVQSLFIQSEEPHMSAAALDPLREIPTVERLELSVDEMDPRAVQSLQSLKQLESFEWYGNFDEACLLALPRMPSVKRLELEPCDYGRLGAGFQTLNRMPNLNHLVVTLTHSEGKDLFRHARLSSTPLALDIRMNRYLSVPAGPFDLSELKGWASVYYLRLFWIKSSGNIDFASMPNLQTIELTYTGLSDADVEQLATLPKLERVTFVYTGINDRQLSQLLSNPNLQGIVINEYDVTSEAFVALDNCSRLESLKVPERAVDAAFLERLRKLPALKQCEVIPWHNEHGIKNDVSHLQSQVDEILQKK